MRRVAVLRQAGGDYWDRKDPPILVPVILDELFYSIILWLAFYMIQLLRRQPLPALSIAATLPLNVFLAGSLWIFYILFPYSVPVGRGHGVSVYVDTPSSTYAVSGFSPIVPIPLEELIENYGEPDDLWLDTEPAAQTSASRVTLHWDSAAMFVELPPMASKMYIIKSNTDIETIVFFGEGPVIGIAGRPLGTQKIPWRGYGGYLP